MVQRDLMSVLMFIEDTTLAASSHAAQEVKQQQNSCLLDLELEHCILIFEMYFEALTYKKAYGLHWCDF